MLVDFAISSLVNELSDSLSGRISEGDVWLNFSDEVSSGLVDSDEGSVVQLSQSQ